MVTVGCVAGGEDGRFHLVRATEPEVLRERMPQEPSADTPLGGRTIRLNGTPEESGCPAVTGHKVWAKRALNPEASGSADLPNLTSTTTLSDSPQALRYLQHSWPRSGISTSRDTPANGSSDKSRSSTKRTVGRSGRPRRHNRPTPAPPHWRASAGENSRGRSVAPQAAFAEREAVRANRQANRSPASTPQLWHA